MLPLFRGKSRAQGARWSAASYLEATVAQVDDGYQTNRGRGNNNEAVYLAPW